MKTDSLRARVTLVTLALLALVLAVVVGAVTIAYRSSLQNDLRNHLAAAGKAVERAGSADAAKGLIPGLALEGIATRISDANSPTPAAKKFPGQRTPTKPGSSIATHGSLLALQEVLPDGTRVSFSASNAPIGRAVNRLLLLELAVALAALALASLLVFRGTKATLRPLSQVIETATKIASGERSLRLRPTRTDTELGRLADAFDRMVDALDGAVQRAEDAESAMRQFLADASHELRTPVAALQASVETLLREQPARPERDEQEAALARSAARLGRLIDDLLNLARLENTNHLPDQTVDLAELVRVAAEEARAQAQAPTILVRTQTPTHVRGDESGLARIFNNLLENALVATPPTGTIEVEATRRDEAVVVRVSDDGPGIPPDQRERIFERFTRLDTNPTGTGLGLAIARRIARQHGGELTCDATEIGASFTLRLPVSD
jgi:signal transduction histidine kinase